MDRYWCGIEGMMHKETRNMGKDVSIYYKADEVDAHIQELEEKVRLYKEANKQKLTQAEAMEDEIIGYRKALEDISGNNTPPRCMQCKAIKWIATKALKPRGL